jgi:hypothetical protein
LNTAGYEDNDKTGGMNAGQLYLNWLTAQSLSLEILAQTLGVQNPTDNPVPLLVRFPGATLAPQNHFSRPSCSHCPRKRDHSRAIFHNQNFFQTKTTSFPSITNLSIGTQSLSDPANCSSKRAWSCRFSPLGFLNSHIVGN